MFISIAISPQSYIQSVKKMEYFTPWFIWLPLTISLLFFLRVAKKRLAYGGKLPPGPTPLPVVGNLFDLGEMPHRSLARLAKSYGPVMSLKLGQVTTIVITSPGAAREAFQQQDPFLSARPVPDATRALGQHETSMVWTPPSENWKHQRAIARHHLFNTQSLDANQGIRRQKVQDLIEYVRAHVGQTVDIRRAAFCTAMNQISNNMFSDNMVNLDFESGQEFKELVTDIMECVGSPNLADFFPVLGAIDPHRVRRRMTAHLSKLYKIFDEKIDRRLKATNEGEELPYSGHDFLDVLLKLHVQDNSKFDRRTIKSLLTEMFIGGTDTSSSVVEWTLLELLCNPTIMGKVRTELKTVIGPGKLLDESDISRLPYLQAVVKETMRFHPPGPLLPRKAEKDIEVGGFIVPRNSTVMVNVWAIGRDENVWKDPELFMPERFLTNDVDFKGGHFELIPFGSGRRMCPGVPLASRMVHLMLGSLINSFEWKLPDGRKPSDVELKERFGLTLSLAVPLQVVPWPVDY